MNRRISAYWAGGPALAITLLIDLEPCRPTNSRAAEPEGPRFEAVAGEIPVGNSVRLEVRLVGADGMAMAAKATVTATRLDMGPDGMGGDDHAHRAGVIRSARYPRLRGRCPPMAGRWALTITASVDGLSAPFSGVVVFTATEKKADATPAASAAGGRRIAYYRHPMGLADTSPVPKQDEMGMDYIPVYEDEISGPVGSVRLSPEKIQRSGIRTAIVSRHAMTRTIRAFGTITADESRMATSARNSTVSSKR